MNRVEEWKELLKKKEVREMISHLHEFTYIRNPDRRMTI